MIVDNKKLLVVILILQTSFCIVLILNRLVNLKLPLLRFTVGFILLTFVPGFLALRIFGLNKLNLETLTYSIGISVFSLMFIGFLLNLLLPIFNIRKPITLVPLIVAVNVFITILAVLAFVRNRSNLEFDIGLPKISLCIPLFILPAIISVGIYKFLYFYNNELLLFLLFIIAVIAIISTLYNRNVELVIWVISFVLLFYGSLSSKYVVVIGDPHVEYYFANLVRTAGIWNMRLQGTHNAMLEVVILQPLYSVLLGINLTWSFKIVYPLIFSFCPLVLYLICKRQFDDEIALLSTFIFIFSPMFYNSYANSTRWGIALFFMSLVVLVMVDNNKFFLQNLKNIQGFLVVIFAFSLVVSHYTSSYIFMFLLFFVLMLGTLLKVAKYRIKLKSTSGFILFYIVSLIGYYLYVASSSAYDLMYSYFRYIAKVLGENILSPSVTYVGFVTKKTWPFSVETFIYFTYLLIILGFIGLSKAVYRYLLKSRKDENISSNNFLYLSGAVYYYIVLAISVLGMFGPPRAFFMSLLFTAPYIVEGWLFIFESVKYIKYIRRDILYLVFILILVIYFLVSSGFVCETITRDGDYSPTVFISKNRLGEIKDPYFTVALYRRYIPDSDVWSACWLSKFRDLKKKIYVDGGTGGKGHVGWVTLHSYGMIRCKGNILLLHPNVKIKKNSYVYLRSYNVRLRVFYYGPPTTAHNLSVLGIEKMNKIYTNYCSNVYLSN